MTWADSLEKARFLRAQVEQHSEEMERLLVSTGTMDQFEAAAADMQQRIDRFSDFFYIKQSDSDLPELDLALLALLLESHPCPHLRGPTPLFVLARYRAACCEVCAEIMMTTSIPDPREGHCDFCDAEPPLFYPLTISKGPFTVIGDVCGDCHSLLKC